MKYRGEVKVERVREGEIVKGSRRDRREGKG